MNYLKKSIFLFVFTFLTDTFCFPLPLQEIKQNDSIKIWLKQAKSKKLDIKSKKKLLLKSYDCIINNKEKLPLELSSIAYEFYKLKDTTFFFKINKEALQLATQTKHTYAIGDAHWNYATYYIKLEFYDKGYYHLDKAFQNFIEKDFKDEASQILQGMSRIKGRFRDYTGAEILNIKAIKLFKELKNYKRLHTSYNHLAQLQFDIKEYDRALYYYEKAIKNYQKSTKKKYIAIYNNIGNVYKEIKNYKKALYYYNIELKNRLTPIQYSMVIDNRAHCKLLMNDIKNIKEDFFKSLSIRDSLKNKEGIVSSKIHISDYYKYIKDTTKALQYAKEANSLAKELKNGGDYLTTLKQLANLDKQNSKKHLDRYIEFNDSLISAERRIQNKFTRIEFETDEYIEETERLSQQRIWIIVTSFAGLLVLSLLYFLRVQKVRNEKLKLEAEQQKANEEVYVLTLQQQAKLEEERVNERNRISAELHDGVLGKLFGTRVNLGFLAMQMKPETQEKHQAFLDELQEIEKEIRDVSHRLSDNFDSSNINFTTILTQLLKDRSTIGNFSYKFNFDKTIPWNEINEVTKANVYRIIQEALQNIIKHAKAKNVTLDASFKREELIISLKDDGIGFNAEKKKKGIGIKNITARVEKLGGTLEFISKENQGTTLVIITPFNTKNGK
ncbi:tetratricopeptide repeat-containing sensor histidine kinase [Tenacibaculum mesophilum]|uniref:tetratricopeptide repeat-containing sensor histidine kinase n=1 Tax=Tenacibaculum mesophilum TaxID=104268 RepID=UPI00064B0FB2|nr:tetratricopeptide repeat-containing sensor histidine kinase [Tenacibaculum mesophilum]